MARVTVEDCIEIVPDRFDLVLLAARRAKQIATGSALLVERDNDKDSVVSLREIAEEKLTADELTEDLIYSFSKRRFQEPKMDAAAVEGEGDAVKEDVKEVLAAESENAAVDQPAAEAEAEAAQAGMSFGGDDVEVED